jgi:CIC family chloride channel protein
MKVWTQALTRLAQAGHTFFQGHWQGLLRIRERLKTSEEATNLLLAGGVGILGGLANLAFFLCAEYLKLLALRREGDLAEIAEALNMWWRLLIPVAGGWLAGLILCGGLRIARPKGPSNFLEAVVAGDGRLPLRNSLINATSSLISISSGASIGREGLLTQLTATFASKWGQYHRWPPYRLRLMVACGAAAGLAAAYNVPLAGAVFAAQIVLGNFSMNLFAPLVFASVTAAILTRSFFGIEPWYQLPSFEFTHLWQLPWFLVLGAASGILGAGFLKLLRLSKNQFQKIPVTLCLRLAFGGLGIGAIAVFCPQVWGNGYSITNDILHQPATLKFLLLLLTAKLVATVVSIGSGAVGGVFTPTLFLGAALGCALGTFLHQIGYALDLPTGVFAFVGMGSLLSATTHSPLLAMLMIFEISLNYSMMPPLMLACAVGTLVARQLHAGSVYTDPLRLQEAMANRERSEIGAATRQSVGELMREPVRPLQETDPVSVMADRFLSSTNNFLPVISAQGRLQGVVALHDLKEHLTAGAELDSVIAFDVMRPVPAILTPDQHLIDVLPILLACELRNIPVVNNPQEKRLVGSLVRSEALGMLSEAIAAQTVPQT